MGDAVVEPVLCGESGVLAGAEPGTIVLDHSTVHPEFARRMEEVCAARGVTYLDAPVSGTGDVAWNGRLTVMVGGDPAAFERVMPALDAVSANARLMGPVGSGNMAKLVNNMVKDVNQLGVLETFVLGAKKGLDCGLLFHVMRNGASLSRQLERILPKILDRSFEQTSYVSTNIKDQEFMEWMIGQTGLELPLRNAARDSWLYAAEQGLASADPPEAIKALEWVAGVEVAGEVLPRDAEVTPPGDAVRGARHRDGGTVRGGRPRRLRADGETGYGRPRHARRAAHGVRRVRTTGAHRSDTHRWDSRGWRAVRRCLRRLLRAAARRGAARGTADAPLRDVRLAVAQSVGAGAGERACVGCVRALRIG